MSRRSNKAVAAFIALAMISACTVQRMKPPVASSGGEAVLDDHMAHMTAEEIHGPMVADAPIDWTKQGHEGLPASNITASARLKSSGRHGEWVKIAWEPGAKDSLMAWVVYPQATGKRPVVVVVHEIFGLSTWVQSVADQVAAEGFIAIAPDLLSKVRGGPSTVTLPDSEARKIVGGVNTTDRNKGIIAVANYAMMLPSAQQKYGVIGYCWGGQTVWAHAVNGGVKGYAGGVAFYGAFPYMNPGTPATATTAAIPGTINTDSLGKIKGPVMLLNGSGDARIAASMPAIDSLMKAFKKEYEGTNYLNATHGFLREQDDPRAEGRAGGPSAAETQAANMIATKEGWPKMVAFLKKNLGVK